MDFLPPENTAVSNLLAIIKDPKAAEQRMNELNEAQATLNSQIERNKVLADEAKAAHLAAEKIRQEAEDLKKQNEATTENLHKMLQERIDSYDRVIKEHQDVASKHIKELTDQKEALAKKEADVYSRENAVTGRESLVSERETEVTALRRNLEAKLEKIKAINE